jgi:hypothetical protein
LLEGFVLICERILIRSIIVSMLLSRASLQVGL